jgi:hypothetical protein
MTKQIQQALENSQRLLDRTHVYLAAIKHCEGMLFCGCDVAVQWRLNDKLLQPYRPKK